MTTLLLSLYPVDMTDASSVAPYDSDVVSDELGPTAAISHLDNGNTLRITGTLAYDLDGNFTDDSIVTGIYILDPSNHILFGLFNFSVDVATLNAFPQAYFDPQLFAGADVIIGSVGGDNLLGFNGNDTLDGKGGNDTLDGGAGNDSLDGGGGGDAMIGSAGADTYIVGQAGDVVMELAGQGLDLVKASISYTLGANVENLTLIGSGNLNGTGNELGNVLTGNGGNNTLNGGAGNDTMAGGTGADTYVVNAAGDVVTELASQGADVVKSSVTFTLAANVEDLTLTGSSSLNGTGNGGKNALTGNSGSNTLNGGNGADTLDGKGAADTLNGGGGADTLVWSSADSFNGGGGADTLKLTGGNLNLTQIDNAKILDVEVIDLTGGGDNVLRLAAPDVLDLSSTTNTLKVLGDEGDSIDIAPAVFQDLGVAGDFHKYKFGGGILLVDTEITVS